MDKGKAQASVEFLITLSLILIIFIIIGFVIFQKFNSTTYIKFSIEGQDVANSLAQGINDIAIAGDGYYSHITLRGDVQGMPYSIRFYANESVLELEVLDMTWGSPLSTPSVNCSLDICSVDGGITTMDVNESRKIRMENMEGVVYLKNETS